MREPKELRDDSSAADVPSANASMDGAGGLEDPTGGPPRLMARGPNRKPSLTDGSCS